MSERDCPDEMALLWAEREERRRHDRLMDHPDCRDPDHPGCSQCRERDGREDEAYAEGRKDEREEFVAALKAQISECKRMAKENAGNPRYDYYADAFEMFLGDYE